MKFNVGDKVKLVEPFTDFVRVFCTGKVLTVTSVEKFSASTDVIRFKEVVGIFTPAQFMLIEAINLENK